MNKQLLATILLLWANYCTRADVQALLSGPKTHWPPLSHPFNTSYLPPAENQHQHFKPSLKEQENATKNSENYRHSKPKVIDDPLPSKVDFVRPLDIDFKAGQPKRLYKGTVFSGQLVNVYEKPLFRERPALLHVNVPQDESHRNNEAAPEHEATFKSSDHHNLKAASSIESRTYVKSPTEIDVIPINFFASHATKFKLFNHDDDNELSGSAPEVIYKPGDDITFIKDTSVIDDYEHTFTEEEYNKTKKSNSRKEANETSTKTTTKPFSRKDLHRHRKESTKTAAASSTFLTKTSLDSQPSAATQHSVTYSEASESSRSGHGYVYEKPKIPFTS